MANQEQTERFLLYSDLKQLGIHYHRVHLRRLEHSGKFPRRIHLSQNRVVWRACEIQEWLKEQVERRDATLLAGAK